MNKDEDEARLNRRSFLKGAAAAGTAGATGTKIAAAADANTDGTKPAGKPALVDVVCQPR